MEAKTGFWNRFFGFKHAKGSGENDEDESVQEEGLQKEEEEPRRKMASHLDISMDHPFIKLYEMWARQLADAPLPHLWLENWEDVEDKEKEKELARLRMAITMVANSRLYQIPKEPEAEPEPEAETVEEPEDSEEAARKRQMEATRRKLLDAAKKYQEESPEEDGGESPEEEEGPPFGLDALPLVYVTSDKLYAWLVIFPPVGVGRELDRTMVEEVLEESKVAFGVDEDLLARLPDDPNRYFHLFLIAKGRQVVHGKDGYIEDFFQRDIKKRYAEGKYGKMDYHDLHMVQSVEKDGVICQIIPPEEGIPGRTVLDEEIPCKEGKMPPLPKGRNTEASEDGLKLLATESGRVEFSGRSFSVKNVLVISGNVDLSTGNINYIGDVHIHGDVTTGFTVRTIGDITIDGVVEAADIEAGGDLIVSKGILGDSKAVIHAHHNVFAKYIENCTIHCRENLKTDCIVNCDVYCDGAIEVRSGRGTIIGGRVRAAQGIDAKIVGSKSESLTYIFLGGQPCADFERESLLQHIQEMETEIEKVERQPDSPAKTQRIGKIRLDLSVGKMKLGQFDKDLKKLKQKLDEQGGCKLKCDIAYPGMILTIGKEVLHLEKETSWVHARLFGGEICLM